MESKPKGQKYIDLVSISILKKITREMSGSEEVSRTFEFLSVFGAAEKIQARNVLSYKENKNSNVDKFFQELDKNPPTSS